MRSKALSFNEYSFVDFYSKPSLNILEAIVFGFQSVSTEFCCYIGDDDFPTLYGMARCVSFWSKTPIMIPHVELRVTCEQNHFLICFYGTKIYPFRLLLGLRYVVGMIILQICLPIILFLGFQPFSKTT